MKVKLLKLKYLLPAFLLVCACAREVAPAGNEVQEGTVYTFRAELDQDVKTAIAQDGTVSWKVGDQIAIWDEKSESFCTFESVEGDGYFSFVGEPGKDYSFTRAFYPASMAKSKNVITLPSAYSISEAESGSFHPMAGDVFQKEETISFKQLGAVLKFSVLGMPEGVREIVLSSAQTSLSGDFSLEGSGFDDGWATAEGEDVMPGGQIPVKAELPEEIHSGEGSGTVTVTLDSEVRRNTVLYFPVPVGAYTCTLTVNLGGSSSEFTTPSLKDIMRKKLVSVAYAMSSFDGGSGTQADPYVISSPVQLQDLSEFAASEPYSKAFYVLSEDLDMNGIAFKPIGSKNNTFLGSFDGQGHTIWNLNVNVSEYAGLFGHVTGTVKNLNLVSAEIQATEGLCAGAVAAFIKSGSIEGCRVDATSTVSAADLGAGGIVGVVKGAVVNSCSSHANVSAKQYAGGIAGYLNPSHEGEHALVINCSYEPVYIDGKVDKAKISTSHTTACMGGIAGSASVTEGLSDADAKIVNCYAYPLELSSSQAESTLIYHAGGILGYAGGNVTVNNCISPVTYSNVLRKGSRLNSGNYSTLNSAAAIVGRVYTNGVTITRSYSKYTWERTYGIYGDISVSYEEGNNQKLGDTNMRGIGTDMAGLLNDGASSWNASNPVKALTWEYSPTFGYPKPVGVDEDGVQTKKVSLMGDSITTFKGYMFSDTSYTMNQWYPQDGTNTSHILNEQETWWWKLIYGKMTSARLEASNTYSGTTITYTTEKLDGMSRDVDSRINENSFQGRAHYGFGQPDVLIFYGGRNDYGLFGGSSDSLLGSYTDEALQAAYDGASGVFYNNYSQGTVAVLRDFHKEHQSAKILVLSCDQVSEGYTSAAKAITDFLASKGMDIRCINLKDITISMQSNPHPDAAGATAMADYIWAQLGDWLDN